MGSDGWGEFVPADQHAPLVGAHPPASDRVDDKSWDGFVKVGGDASATPRGVGQPGAATPTADDATAALRAGETVWCKLSDVGAHLGSGVSVRVVNAADEEVLGWRRASVVDSGALTVELLPLARGVPPQRVGDEPGDAFPVAPSVQPPAVRRPAPFPVGARTANISPLHLAIGAAVAGWCFAVLLICTHLVR